ncbi:hypothetical protein N7495_003269 [Penicillium taxi]|uniref:uncharacterized protein n=1 Tax=Penicillium taxi TaxID=168475 RepID=UPI0025459308|nr:uncharacterized protein N7495_003269 [Penicillium taxi]KAJ5902741.1 hypothetical protein N7495_003269 [Penicillium taxi]
MEIESPQTSHEHILKRVSRACLHCRQRKSRCDLDSNGNPGKPPCQRCVREHRECVLGGSNRGGRRIRKNKIKNFTPTIPSPNKNRNSDTSSPTDLEPVRRPSASYPGPVVFVSPNHPSASAAAVEEDDASIGSVPRNPSDAWQCLTGIADGRADRAQSGSDGFSAYNGLRNSISLSDFNVPSTGIRAYRLVQSRSLDSDTVWLLITRYAENFHPYLPLVPRKYFDRATLNEFANNDKYLLTAVLTVASKDVVERPEIHEFCSKYMLELISAISAGADCDVDAVEALLLLAEWEPQGLRSSIERVGRGEEDRAAWMHVGLALRSGYFMGLDRTSFRGDQYGDQATEARRRLAWANCYVSDRLISVRIGRAFWSRGPGPMTGLVSHDFPSLQPIKEGDEDYSKILQAQLDLTQLYGNVHEVLYSGMRASSQMMLMGDYVKYVDDFRLAILRWKSLWGPLDCSAPMRATLQLSYEYLRLYTTAFAFQAAISQSLAKPKADGISHRDQLISTFKNVASMPDSRFIYESVDAAKAYLTILVDNVDPEKHLHFMPLRFYLYGIYSAVFLYKARSFGMMVPSEEAKVQGLVARTTEVLRQSSAGPDDIGSRYSRLLELLWKPKTSTAVPSAAETPPTNGFALRTALTNPVTDPITDPVDAYMDFSPANDFSWLDLEAVGDYVSGDPISGGLLGLDAFQNMADSFQPGAQNWQPSSWLGDISTNLLF